jgi:hypothetical protein
MVYLFVGGYNEILTALGVIVSVENFNLICGVPVIVSGNQGSVFIDVIQVGEEARDGSEGVAGVLEVEEDQQVG